jgi:hypothetical protein
MGIKIKLPQFDNKTVFMKERLMFQKRLLCAACLCICAGASVLAQTHVSVPLENQVYYILEQAQARGICSPLSSTRPYTRNTILRAISEILSVDSSVFRGVERDILEQYQKTFSKPEKGFDLRRGAYYNETALGTGGVLLSVDAGVSVNIEGSAGLYLSSSDYNFSTEDWVKLFVNGDIGSHISWHFSAEGGLMLVPRRLLGTYNTYYEGFQDDGEFQNRLLPVYSEPLTHFPYTYKKRWDGSVFFLTGLSSFSYWPDRIAGGYNLYSELSGSFLNESLFLRLGRLSHEWGVSPSGSSLALNQAARPFLGIEAEFNPFSWFGISTLTGVLEYVNTEGIKVSSMNFQNAFSISKLQFNYKNYFSLDIGEGVIWAKRFELGYLSPITNSIFYQNNIGDFDNMSMFATLKAQYPGIGNLWFSLFWDEAYWVPDFYELDRTMLAIQAGAVFVLPFLSFSSVKVTYSKINPYCYTHNRNFNPWYGDLPMETSYTNNGVGLGYYLPPNSDEILIQFKTMPRRNIAARFQYQLIRHGADFGPDAVDGSSLLSELDPSERDSNPVLKRYFLHDGAYQWMHIIKLGAELTLGKLPVCLYFEAGAVISYFTGIEAGKANSGSAYPYSIIDTQDYPKSTGLIAQFGFKLFP